LLILYYEGRLNYGGKEMENNRTQREIVIGILKNYLGFITEKEIPFVSATPEFQVAEIKSIIEELEQRE